MWWTEGGTLFGVAGVVGPVGLRVPRAGQLAGHLADVVVVERSVSSWGGLAGEASRIEDGG